MWVSDAAHVDISSCGDIFLGFHTNSKQLNPLLWVAPHTTSSKTLWLSISHGLVVHRVLEGRWHCSTTLFRSVTWLCLWLFSQLRACSSLLTEDCGFATWKIRGDIFSSIPDPVSLVKVAKCCSLKYKDVAGAICMLLSILWSLSLPPWALPQTCVVCDTHHVLLS